MMGMLMTCRLSEAQMQAGQPGLEGSIAVPSLSGSGVVVWKSSGVEPHQAVLQNYGFHWVLVTLRALCRPQCSGALETEQGGRGRASESLGQNRSYRHICQVNDEECDHTSGRRGQVRRHWCGERGVRVT